jgi:hypothetical protein
MVAVGGALSIHIRRDRIDIFQREVDMVFGDALLKHLYFFNVPNYDIAGLRFLGIEAFSTRQRATIKGWPHLLYNMLVFHVVLSTAPKESSLLSWEKLLPFPKS